MIYPFHDLCRPDDSVIIIPTHWSCGMVLPGFLKLVSPKTKAGKTLLGPIKPNNPSVPMTYKGQSSFGITTILYTYWASKILFGPIKPTNPSVPMAYKGQSSFGINAILYTYWACKILFGPIKPTNPSIRMAYKSQSSFGKPVVHWESCYNFALK